VGVHPALRELPAIAPHAPRPEDATVRMHQDDADVGPVTVRIDHDADSKFTATDSATPVADRQAMAKRIDGGAPRGNNSRFRAAGLPCGPRRPRGPMAAGSDGNGYVAQTVRARDS